MPESLFHLQTSKQQRARILDCWWINIKHHFLYEADFFSTAELWSPSLPVCLSLSSLSLCYLPSPGLPVSGLCCFLLIWSSSCGHSVSLPPHLVFCTYLQPLVGSFLIHTVSFDSATKPVLLHEPELAEFLDWLPEPATRTFYLNPPPATVSINCIDSWQGSLWF